MTTDEIREIVRGYIISGHESDNADCLHEMDAFDSDDEEVQDDLKRAYELYETAIVTVTWK